MKTALACVSALTALAAAFAGAAEPDPRGIDFFETKIRPVLVAHCYECHSADADAPAAGLRVDTRSGLLQGGDSGPAVVPEKVEESRLIAALRGDDLSMPPDGRLPEQVIADFEAWVRMGAPDPRSADAAVQRVAIDLEAGRQFWAFQSPAAAVVSVDDSGWSQTRLDRLVRARQVSSSVVPGPDADRRVLVRRAYFDLLGLPPSPEELHAYLADDTPDAWPRLIDRLLASPHFGERWGRHWLDVARYADSTGGGRSMLYGQAWRYRDYVVESFNSDRPFDTFLIEQIAGDLLPCGDPESGARQLIATAFLALGPSNYEEQDKDVLRMDVVDEQIDTVGRAFLAMTLGCARCHDHKFDPVPTTDYYALAGIFRSTQTLIHDNVSTWVTRPLPVDADTQSRLDAYTQRLEQLQAAVKMEQQRVETLRGMLPGVTVDDEAGVQFTGTWASSRSVPPFVGQGYRYASGAGAAAAYSVSLADAGLYEVRVAYTAHPNRAPRALVTVLHRDGTAEIRLDQRQPPPLDGLYASVGRFHFEAGLQQVTISTEGTEGIVVADAVQLVAVGSDGPIQADQAATLALAAAEAELERFKQQLAAHQAAAPAFPPQVMSVRDETEAADCCVCLRGNVHQPGEVVPRGFLSVIAGEERPTLAPGSSGRLELAHWIASAHNPLTARVIVNRVWAHLFGRGLVPTVDNFGTTGERPTHPELLDDLAVRFMQRGWSVKNLIREIMRSRTYQLASTAPAAAERDPENALLARQNRRRLEVECLVDAMLSLSGELDVSIGGDTVRADVKREYGYEFDVGRRALYFPVFRNQLPPAFAEFDFPDPNLSIGARTTTTLPTQALLLMNSPFAIERARRAAERLLRDASEPEPRIRLLFERALGRPPTEVEHRVAIEYIESGRSADDLPRWTDLCLSIIACIDFRYIE